MTSSDVNMTYMTLTPQTGTGVIYLRVGGLCKISRSFQLNVTVVFCDMCDL